MTPQTMLAGLVLWGASLAGVGWWAYGQGQDHEIATQVREDKVAAIATEAAARSAAHAISQIEVRNVTIKQAVETRIREVPVYRDCRHAPGVLDNINAALTGSQPAGGGVLPAASAAH
jgi:uncharacterized protein HemX